MKLERYGWIARAAIALALPICAFADLSGTKTLTTSSGALKLDTGDAQSTGGDILWNAITIVPQGTAKAYNLPVVTGSLSPFQSKASVDAFKSQASNASIPSSALVVGDVFLVFTNGGNSAAVLVTANDGGGSITLQFNVFGTTGGSGGGPTITNVLNNSSEIPAGFPNSGIAQGSLFKILGSGLADAGDGTLHDSQAAGGLPTTLNGATVTVTAGATVIHPPLYYSTPTQIDAVLPPNAPIGSATVTVAKGSTSNAFTIQIVAAAPGITPYNGSGIAQHALTGGLVTYTNSAAPGETIILWGTGLGATSDSASAYTGTPHQTTVPYTIYIGGVAVTPAYSGRSVYPGVDVFGVVIPASVPTGCYVPVAAVTGSVVSNVVTLPIRAGNGTCSDPQLGYDGNQVSTLNGQGSVKNGFLIVSQSTALGLVTNSASGIFSQTTGVTSSGGGTVSIGGCILSQTVTGGSTGSITGLNAGTITVSGPGGTQNTLNPAPTFAGLYFANLSTIPSTGGAYVFTGSGGSGQNAVGAFTATVNFPNPLLNWTSSAASVSRAQGLNVTWTGGAPGSYVTITGTSVNGTASGGFTCIAPQSALQFTVPSYILLGLPAGTGTTTVQNSTNFTTFTAPGLDFGGALGSVSFSVESTYN